MKNSLLVFLLFVLSIINISAQIDKEKKYKYESTSNDPLGVRKYVLKNGLTVYTSVNQNNEPRIYTCIAIAAGSKHDPKDNTGLAHYLEHMLFKGTDQFGTLMPEKEQAVLSQIEEFYEKYNKTVDAFKRKQIYRVIDSLSSMAANFAIPNEYDKMMQFIGAKGTNAYTSFDETVYINDIPSNQFDAWLKIEAERFRNPIFRLFHTELEAVYEEKNMSLDSDNDKVFDALMASLFKNHSYGLQTTIGKSDHLKNPSLKAIRAFYNKYYVPNNMAICLAGNFDPDEVVGKIDRAFENYKGGEFKEPKFKSESIDSLAEYITVKGPEQEMIAIGFRLPKPDAKSERLLELLSEILYNGTTGLIDKNLLSKQKVLNASVEVMNLKDYAVLMLFSEPLKGQKLSELTNLLLGQLDSIRSGTITDEQIQYAILNIKTRKVKALENSANRSFEMVDIFLKEYNLNEIKLSDSLFQKMKKKDLIGYVNKNLTKDYSVVFKVQDESVSSDKIVKPEITPVPLNRKDNSLFAKSVYSMPVVTNKPQFIDFNRSIQNLSLGKGIEGYYVRNNTNEIFRYQVIFEFGRFYNPYLQEAIDLLQLSGAGKMSNQSLKESFYKIACDFSFNVGDHSLTFELSGPEKSFERAIATLDYWITNATIDNLTLNQFIKSHLQQRENMKSDPDIIRNALNNYALYGNDNPFKRQLSNKQLKALKPDILSIHVSTLFNYPHIINYYGPGERSSVEKLITKNHKVEITRALPERVVFMPQKATNSKVYFADFNMVQANITWLAANGPIDTARFATAALYNEYFGGGMSSIVFQEIRESKALAYSANAYFRNPAFKEGFETSGAFVGTQADKLDSAIIAMNRLLSKMPLSESLFRSSKQALLSAIENERISPKNFTTSKLAYKRQGIDYDFRQSIYRSLQNLQLKDIDEFHQAKTAKSKYVLTVVGSKKRVDKKRLSKYGEVEEVKVDNLLGFR
jgi:predicted Zn-dependent peptidase